jgi:hypothetical protein
MATTSTTTSTSTTALPFSAPVGFVAPGVATGGVTGGSVTSTFQSKSSPVGQAYNYTLVVQIPFPWFNLKLNLNLLGNFILPALTALGIPKAVQSFSNNAVRTIQNIVNDATKLIKAIPEATVTILVKVGPVVVLNVVLVAQKVPVMIPIPTFQLGLPNFVLDPFANFQLPFPVPPPIHVAVPVPVPVIAFPHSFVTVSGGSIFATGGLGSSSVAPYPVTSPIYLPQI